MLRYRVKRLHDGYASIRDYIIEAAKNQKVGITVEFLDMEMFISYEKLKDYDFQIHEKKFHSKWGSKTYSLIDFKFEPDKSDQFNFDFS
jgi:hypothetical protein|tara:strand:- start:891 stop:1157 length:267 start_codon:yes stop_codon:yes gene_type:complete